MVVARKMGVDEYGYEERSQAYQRLSRELLLVQRNALVRLGNEGTISDETLHRIGRDLDLEETRLDSRRLSTPGSGATPLRGFWRGSS